ncbi:GIY-YIG nuclease family protein [Burkholderia sp. TSV86]|uniref:GIY-YIG nuclease family protein n=1 Tax=Burkholderia sp. TSV86 TaxID=1385594 RepID=UPI000759FE4C|nr:GIY-YIG nuclease family protein [Burkholderia sp. TSV86]KVE39293.1 hypothetical protein WS68_21155 [Burkholderia sp. TSV86]
MSWYLYLIECADGSVYTGITTDVAARFAQHVQGKGARYTRARKPRAVLASFELADRSSASRAEYRVKQLTAAQKRALASGALPLTSVLPATAGGGRDVDAGHAAGGTDAAENGTTAAAADEAAGGAAVTRRTRARQARRALELSKPSKPSKPSKHSSAANGAKLIRAAAASETGNENARAATPHRVRAKQNRAAS